MNVSGEISIVLVETSHPGNVGAAARAMRVMGLKRLVLVAPRCKIGSEARARASGAVDVLDEARVEATLAEAIAGARFVVGTSARSRNLGPRPVAVRAGMDELARELGLGDVAILFGPERTGLDNAALARCNRLWHIPSAESYSSLNLAAAVQVVAYEVFLARGAAAPTGRGHPAASAAEVAGLMGHFDRAARAIGFIAPDAPRRALRRLERLARRARLEASEVKLLRGFLSAAERIKRPPDEH
ncbi:MAG: RNA methyltransferase [Gammaproteobacteria bacterium]